MDIGTNRGGGGGGALVIRRIFQSLVGSVYNFKLGHFATKFNKFLGLEQPHLELKTWLRGSLFGKTVSMDENRLD